MPEAAAHGIIMFPVRRVPLQLSLKRSVAFVAPKPRHILALEQVTLLLVALADVLIVIAEGDMDFLLP